MLKRVKSRKFISPTAKEDKKGKCEASDFIENSDSELTRESNSKTGVSGTMSDSQYDDLFSSVIGSAERDIRQKEGSHRHRDLEDKVAVPEPNAALSPAESAEEGGSESTGSAAKTPDQRIDNSVLPPVKRKKPSSKIARLRMKIKPTKLNFDDPALLGDSENLPKPKKSKSLPSKTFKKPKTSSKQLDYKDLQKPCKPDSKKKSGPKTPDVRESINNEFETPIGRGIDDSQRSTGSLGQGASFQTPNSQLLCSQASSIQAALLSPRSKLFRLHRKRNVGLWVQCTNKNCNKWRYLPSTRDPTDVPENWQCFMNHDKKYGSCSAPEKGPTPVEEEDLIHNLYTAGSVVWGHLAGYPWWPGMVDDDPDVEQYYWITENCDIPTHYNVTFFDDKPVTRAWLTPRAIAKFSQLEYHQDINRTSTLRTDYRRRLEVAKRQAEEALRLPINERLKKFSFPARYKGPIGQKRYPSDSEDEEVIQKSVKRAGKVPRKDKAVLEEDPMKDIMESLEAVKEVNEVLNELMSDSGSDEDNSAAQNLVKGKKKGELHSGSKPSKGNGKKLVLEKELQKVNEEKKGVGDINRGDKDSKKLKGNACGTAELKKKISKKGKNDIINKGITKEDDKEVNKSDKMSKEMGKKVNHNKDTEQSKKNNEVVRKEVDMNLNEITKKDKKIDKTSNVKLKESKSKPQLKQKKASNNDENGSLIHAKKPSKNNLNQGKKKNDGHNKITSINIMVDDDKGQKEKSNTDAGQESCVNNDKNVTVESKNASDAEDSSVEFGKDSESVGSDGKKEDETSSSEQESDSDSNTNSEANESDALISQVIPETCGRSSADLFEPQNCNPEQPSSCSQHSADFECEE